MDDFRQRGVDLEGQAREISGRGGPQSPEEGLVLECRNLHRRIEEFREALGCETAWDALKKAHAVGSAHE